MRRLLATVTAVAVAAIAAGADAPASVTGTPPTVDKLAARAKALGLKRYVRHLRRDALPGARLEAGGRDIVGGSRLGGRPDLPRSMAWPRCKGQALSFLAQLRIDDLRSVGAVAPRGTVLSFFAALREDRDGIAPVEEADGRVGQGTCVIVRLLDGPLTRRSTPPHVKTLRNRPVVLRRTLTIPDSELAHFRYGLPFKGKVSDAWSELWWEAVDGTFRHRRTEPPIHQVFGWPAPVQEAPLYGCGSTRRPGYRLLLQLDWDEPLRFAIGDGGALYITGRPADLRAGRYDRLCAEFQDG